VLLYLPEIGAAPAFAAAWALVGFFWRVVYFGRKDALVVPSPTIVLQDIDA